MTDLLVIGGGIAGMTAAARAARNGLSVTVVERAPALGGSGLYAGFIWTAPSVEVLAEVNPGGDPELSRALVDGFAGAVDWIRSLGVPCGDPVTVLRYGRGHQFDTAQYVQECRRLVEGSGEILTGTATEALVLTGGAVTGARLRLPDGSERTIEARSTVLATGGFQADPDLRAELLHPQAREVELRSNPWSRGDGMRLAAAAGAAIGPPDAGFYGHLVPAGVRLTDAVFVDLALYYSEHALLFNLAGERFVDETVGDHLTTMALLAQPEARGLLVTDAQGYREWITGSYVEGVPGLDKFALARRHGARCVVADSAEDFAEVPPEWGYAGERIATELARLAAGGAPSPSRQFDDRPPAESPYYVVEASPAVTFPFAGIRIDATGRVLDGEQNPVPGLLSAGSDTGGLYVGAYAGGIAPAVVFALAAADLAASYTAV